MKEKGWGEFVLEASFSFQSGERMKIKHPLLFEPDYQEKFYETKVLLDLTSLKIKQVPVIYEESFLRDFGDKLCSLNDTEMMSVFELMQTFTPRTSSLKNIQDLFVFNCSEPADLKMEGGGGSKAALLRFNLNSFSIPQLGQLCKLVDFPANNIINSANVKTEDSQDTPHFE